MDVEDNEANKSETKQPATKIQLTARAWKKIKVTQKQTDAQTNRKGR